jgi:hypothetical protein
MTSARHLASVSSRREIVERADLRKIPAPSRAQSARRQTDAYSAKKPPPQWSALPNCCAAPRQRAFTNGSASGRTVRAVSNDGDDATTTDGDDATTTDGDDAIATALASDCWCRR